MKSASASLRSHCSSRRLSETSRHSQSSSLSNSFQFLACLAMLTLCPNRSPWEQVGTGESYRPKEYKLTPPKPKEEGKDKK